MGGNGLQLLCAHIHGIADFQISRFFRLTFQISRVPDSFWKSGKLVSNNLEICKSGNLESDFQFVSYVAVKVSMSRCPDSQICRFFRLTFQIARMNLEIWKVGVKDLDIWKSKPQQLRTKQIEFPDFQIRRFPDFSKLTFQISRFF